MKIVRVNVDDTMDDIEITSSTKKNIINKLSKITISKGDTDLKELYRWLVASNIELICYGYYDGSSGFENKHDLPPNGISDFLDDDDNSSSKLLFGDIFICLFNNKDKKFKECCVSDYGAYYEELFEGFDDCELSEEESQDESVCTEDEDFIVDDKDEHEEEDDENDDYFSDENLDLDENDYTTSESEYDEECEGETDDEGQ